MIASFCLILLCQLGGEIVVRSLGVPVPGPVLGLLFLFVLLLVRDRFPVLAQGPLAEDDTGVEVAAGGLLANLAVLFVPAGVGIIQKLDLLAEHGLAIVGVLAISVVLTLVATVGSFVVVNRLMARWR